MQEQIIKHQIGVHPPKLQPRITTIGYGNPRYNSMVVYKPGVLIPIGCHLRWICPKQNKVYLDKQIGCCQIFEIMENKKYILVINYDGLITLLHKENLQMAHQFYSKGKEIRHASFTDQYLAVAIELLHQSPEGQLLVYSIHNIQTGNYQEIHSLKGHFYYPEYEGDQLTVLQYKDPNPKGRKRKETVMNQKLPITNQLIKLDNLFKTKYTYKIAEEGEIICCSHNKGIVYYLHSTKKITIFDIKGEQAVQLQLQTKSFPHLVQNYQNGVVYAYSSNKLAYLQYNFQLKQLKNNFIQINSQAIGANLSLKFAQNGIYALNQTGFHFYQQTTKHTYTQTLFSITNCGIAFNSTASLFTVADFAGSFFVFNTNHPPTNPDPLFSLSVGIPIRSIAWCPSTNNIVIGCVGGTLFWWKYGSVEPEFLLQFDTTINIIRAVGEKIYAGASDGRVIIFDSKTMCKEGQYKAHHPIDYQTEQERQLFGSMKNYAQIWSLTIPQHKQETFIVSSCEDQTQKVYRANLQSHQYQLLHHLKGHQLAVTSVDWKLMNEKVGEIYVSCSDDKIIRFRDPQQHFKILFELETTTIKEWHTLTYLALEPQGHRVAIGSQNGYLFIYDIPQRSLLFGQKVHLGGIQGLDWTGNTLCTCSSDLCVNIYHL